MRFNLILSVKDNTSGSVLPINYQYEVSSWIYKVLNDGDTEFAHWLHEKGYIHDKRPFKLFTFSRLAINSFHVKGDRLIIRSPQVTLTISFLPDEAITPFIKGLFLNRIFSIGDILSKVTFEVSSIEETGKVTFNNEMHFRTTSPLFISDRDPESGHKRHLSPDDSNYNTLLERNLTEKFNTYSKVYTADNPAPLHIKVIPQSFAKERLVRIKGFTDQQTYIKAYDFQFKAIGSPELIRTGYFAGFGALNSQGFGCVEIIS